MKLQKILIIDDEFHTGYLIKINLESEGYTVALALSGEEGLEKARVYQPDLITLDVLMPEMDGLKVLAALKKDESLRLVPVIMISVVNEMRRRRSLEMGASDYLLKPLDFENLLNRIKWIESGGSARK